jgi:hypothetical protein
MIKSLCKRPFVPAIAGINATALDGLLLYSILTRGEPMEKKCTKVIKKKVEIKNLTVHSDIQVTAGDRHCGRTSASIPAPAVSSDCSHFCKS